MTHCGRHLCFADSLDGGEQPSVSPHQRTFGNHDNAETEPGETGRMFPGGFMAGKHGDDSDAFGE